jgi:hypothetical protein
MPRLHRCLLCLTGLGLLAVLSFTAPSRAGEPHMHKCRLPGFFIFLVP